MDIVTEGLSKTYRGGIEALQGVDLSVGPGMFGLLGPNGAGKTTLMRILATLLRPTKGTARVGGYRVDDRRGKWAIREFLGYLPQDLVLYGDLSAAEFLDFVAALKHVGGPKERRQEVQRVLELAGLTAAAKQRLRTFSGGMRRRAGIAQALLGSPSLLIVDEPTAGLDPEERVRFRNLLVELARDRLILLSTHIVEDVAQTCTQLAVLQRGRLLFKGAVSELIGQAQGRVWAIDAPGYEPGPGAILVASTRTALGMQYRVLADEQPHPDASPAVAGIEDGYLWLMRANHDVLS